MSDMPTPAPMPAPVPAPAPTPSRAGEVIAGFFLAIGLHFAVLGGLALMGTVAQPFLIAAGAGLLCIGATEWLYLVPTVIYLRRHGRGAIAKGVLISGGIVALLNGACWGIFMVNPPNFH